MRTNSDKISEKIFRQDQNLKLSNNKINSIYGADLNAYAIGILNLIWRQLFGIISNKRLKSTKNLRFIPIQ